MRKNRSVHVIGAIIIDIVAKKEKFLLNTSNLANFSLNLGGVGHNIYQGIKGIQKLFHTVIGNDYLSPVIKNYLDKEQAHYQVLENVNNGIYAAFMQAGELLLAAADCSCLEKGFSKKFVQEIFSKVEPSDLVVFDSNIPAEGIHFIISAAKEKNCDLFFETVSVEKAKRTKSSLFNLELMTPTEEELLAMIPSLNSGDVANFMHYSSIKNIILTQGKNGLTHFYFEGEELISKIYSPQRKLSLKDSNGAGDFLLSSLISKLYFDKNYPAAIENAMREVENFLSTKIF